MSSRVCLNHLVFLLLLVVLATLANSADILTSLPTPAIINQYSTYEFTLIDSGAWTRTGTVEIIFQSPPYTFTSNSNITNCKETVTSNTYGLGCVVSTSSKISFSWTSQLVTNVGTSNTDSLTFSIVLLNPSYVDTFTVTYSFTLSNGTVYSNAASTIKGFSSDALTYCGITFNPSYTNYLSSAIIQFIPKNPVPSGGSFIITASNSGGYTTGNTVTSITTSNSSILSTSASISQNSQTYIFSNLFIAATNGGTFLSFNISSIMSPPTTALNTYFFTLTTLYTSSYLNSIDTKTCYLSVSDYPITLSVAYTGIYYVGDTIKPNLTYTTPIALSLSTDTLNFIVDSSSTGHLAISTASSSGNGGYLSGSTTASYSLSNITGGVSFPVASSSDTFTSNTSVLIAYGISIKSLINSGTKTVYLQVFRNKNSYASGKATITVRPNTLSSVLINLASTTVSASTTYTFTITVKNPLSTGGGVRITLPSDLAISTGTCTATATSSYNAISSSVSCSATSSTVIMVTNIFSASFPSNTTFTVSVANIVNAISVKTTGSLLFQTFYSSSELTNPVDNSTALTGLTLTPTLGSITAGNFNIARNNTYNMQYALYTITYVVTSRFGAGGYLTIAFPSSMILSTSKTCSFTVKNSATNITSSSQSITPTAIINGTTNYLYFNFTGLITTNLAAGSIITIIINSLRNYYSFKPVKPQLTTYSSDGYLIQQSTVGDITLTNTIEDTSLVASLTTSARMNGNPTNCTFSITSPSNMISGDAISITLQSTNNINTQMYYSSNPSCVVAGTTASCSIDSSSTYLLSVTLGTSLTASTASTLSIANVIFSRSFDQPGLIYFRTFEASEGKLYNISSYTLTTPINTQTNAIKTVSLSIDTNGGTVTSLLNQLQKFKLTVSATNQFQAGDIVVVTIPSQYTFVNSLVSTPSSGVLASGAGSLCAESTLYCSNNNSNGNYLRVVERVAGSVFTNISSFSFTVNNGSYQSPLYWANYNSQVYLVNSYSSTGQPIDAVQSGTTTNATFYLTCSSNNYCNTCYANGSCSSCYALGTGYNTNFTYGAYYLITSTGVCVQSCTGNFYASTSKSCLQCTAPCYGCSVTDSNCTSCINYTINGLSYYYYNSSCITTCPSGYYASSSGNTCQVCANPCLTCSGSNVYCTSCFTNKYLSTRLGTCGDASICNASYEYPDSTTFKCTNCSASCNGCSINSTHCAACQTGYIIDIAYGTTLPGRCTNLCPSGTVNDTAKIMGGGCTCNYTACATCQTTVNTCLSCNGSKYLQSGACVSTCSSGYYLSNLSCISCISNCSTCTSSACTKCNSPLYLYQDTCISACPTYTTSTLSNGGNICFSCGSGCITCIDTSSCQTCTTGLYMQINSTNRLCVNTCVSPYYTYNSQCLVTCPSGTAQSGTNCVTVQSNSSSTLTTTSSSRFIPFPYTIGLSVLAIATVISKLGLSYTIIPAGLCAFGGFVESLSWITLIIVAGVDSTTSSNAGMYVVLIAFMLNLILNIFSLHFFKKYIWGDQKFSNHFKRLQSKTKSGACVTYTCIILAGIFSHKFLQIMFSNLFESGFFVYKVKDKAKLTSLNYLLYISLIPSTLAIIGGGVSSYDLQILSLNSVTFIQSIDLIIVTIFSAIFGFWVTIRKQEDYEVTLAEIRGENQEQLDHDILGDGPYQVEEQQKKGNKRSKYQHKSSYFTNDPRQDPINRKNTNRKKNPIGEEVNLTNVPLGEREDDENRLNLHDLSGPSTRHRKKKGQNEIDVDQINFIEDEGLQSLPPSYKARKNLMKSKQLGKGIKGGSVGANSYRYKKQKEEDPAKQKLKDNIENKLTSQQIQKTKIVRDVDKIDTSTLSNKKNEEGSQAFIKEQTKNQQKKEKLELISNSSPEKLNNIPEKDRVKAGEIKKAMKLLNNKKIEIGEYLEYLDIIQEEDQDRDSNDYDLPPKPKPANSNKKKLGKKDSTSKKGYKRDRTARNLDKELFVHDTRNIYDDPEPEIPDFNHTPINRKLSENNFNFNDDEFDNNNYTSLNKNNRNRSDQHFPKKSMLNVLESLESAQNYDKSLGEEFKKGNILKPVDREEAPPSNLYSTEKFGFGDSKNAGSVPLSKNRIIPNTLINDDTQIQYLQSEGGEQETIKGQLLDFNNDVSPSHFNQLNMRIQNDQISQAPTKPKINKKTDNNQVGKVENIEDEDIDQEDFNDGERQLGDELPESKLQRYQSNQGMLDYDDILSMRKKNEKVKQLEKIYLPRQNVNRPNPRKKKNLYTSQSYRKQES